MQTPFFTKGRELCKIIPLPEGEIAYMASKDIVNKAMFSDPDVLADLMNRLYFGGSTYLSPERITDGPTDLCLYKECKGRIEVTKREADVCRLYYKGEGSPVIVLCVENQTCYDPDMKSRVMEYNKLIREELMRSRTAGADTPIIFLNVVITYCRTDKPKADTAETDEYVKYCIEGKKSKSFIREFRPAKESREFKTELGILFECIRLNRKSTERELYAYVKDHLKAINDNPDIAYYLKETTGIDEITVDPSKLAERKDIMSLWTVLQEESRKEGREIGLKEGHESGLKEGVDIGLKKGQRDLIMKMLDNASIEEISRLTGLSVKEIEDLIKNDPDNK